MRDFGKRVTKMTQQFTKEDYQVVLDRIYQLDGMTFSDHQKTDAIMRNVWHDILMKFYPPF
jgi:predicted RNA-binding protein (virulence factor B family)